MHWCRTQMAVTRDCRPKMLIEFQNKPNEYISLLSLYYSGLWITHIIIMLIYNIFEYMHDFFFFVRFCLSSSSCHMIISSYLLMMYTLQAITMIGKEEGIKGYWKGNLPQVCCWLNFLFSESQNFTFPGYEAFLSCIFIENSFLVRWYGLSLIVLFSFLLMKLTR